MVRIHLVGGKVHEGKIYAVDPVTLSIILALEDEENSYVLINSSQITQIEGNINSTATPNVAALGLSTVKSIQKREQDSLIAAEKGIAALNFEVNPKIQALFDSFNKTLPCRWEGNDMIILESYIISAPGYEVIKPIGQITDASAFKRLEKKLEVERSKIGF